MRSRSIAMVVVIGLAAAACGNSSSGKSKSTTTSGGGSSSQTSIKPGSFPAVTAPGVTATEIRVSGVASTTNPLGGLYGTAFDGVQAYFNMVNAQGGIYGRKLVLVNRHDDQLSQNKREVEAIVDQDNVFAVLPVATIFSFSGASLLAQKNIPTFGWNINDEWTGPPNLFGHTGALCNGSDCPGVPLPWVAQKLGKKRLAVLAYNVANSAQCLDGIKASFDKYPTAKIVYSTKSLSFGVTDMSADVKKMIDAKVDFVATCMDSNGVLTLAREMRQQGLNAIQSLPNGYDHDFIDKNGGFFEGSIVAVQEAPLETTPKFAALQDYITWMGKAGYKTTENAEVGWVNADTLVTGLKAAGPDFSQQKLIDALNQMTAFDAGGMIGPVNWVKQHTDRHYPLICFAYLKIHNSKFVPTFSPAGKPFTCFIGDPPTMAGLKIEYKQ